MGDNKVTNSQIAYYITVNDKQLITVDDAKRRLEEGVSLRNCLFDVGAYTRGERLPLKFVPQGKKRAYFATRLPNKEIESANNDFKSNVLKWFCDIGYDRIDLGRFKIDSNYITDVRHSEMIQFGHPDNGTLITLHPDVVLQTGFMDFFIHIWDFGDKLDLKDSYKAYRKYRVGEMPFTVIQIDLRDLKEKSDLLGYSKVKDLVEERLTYINDYKEVVPIISLDIDDAPFGWNPRTGLPFQLYINTYPDGYNVELKKLLTPFGNCIRKGSFEFDGLNTLYLTDSSPEHPKYQLHCPKHLFEPLKLLRQSSKNAEFGYSGKAFFKCDLWNSKYSEDSSDCDFTMTFCDKFGQLEDEYLVAGDLSQILTNPTGVVDRLKVLRKCCVDYKNKKG